MCRGRNIRGVVYLQNQNYLVMESLKCSSKSKELSLNRNDSHKYHDENHDEIKFYQGNSNRSIYDTYSYNLDVYNMHIGAFIDIHIK